MLSRLVEFTHDEEGTTAVEYAVLLALILMAIISAIGTFGTQTNGLWTDIKTDFDANGFGS